MSSRPESRGCVGAVILAAGESKRLGQPKQLIVRDGRTFLERTIEAALEAGAARIAVVLGSAADEIEHATRSDRTRVRFVRNPAWREGMGTSIACGVRELASAAPKITAALILVCDQPALDATLLRKFLENARAAPDLILVADYGTGRGPPVLFPRQFLEELQLLRGDSGAREVHMRHPDRIRLISFSGGALDIDTPADLARDRGEHQRD